MIKPNVEEIREQFNKLIELRGRGALSAAARAMGYPNSAALAGWRKGKYAGDNDKVTAAVGAFLERESERDALVESEDTPFIRTSISQKVFEVARKAHLTRSICLVVGPSGVGKTRSLKEYARINSDVILIECHRSTRARDVMSDIHLAIGLDGKGTVHSMMRGIVSKLKNSGRLIILDEAENLNPTALDEIRRIYDFAGVGVLYVGLERFYARLVGMHDDYEYIVNRVRNYAKLEKLRQKDTNAIVSQLLPDATDLSKELHVVSQGNARVLIDLCRDAAEVANINDVPVNSDILRAVKLGRAV